MRDAASDHFAASFSLGELVYEYNTTLKSLLDSHAPLKTKTITLRPTALWYTEELRSEKKKRRALERRWRSSKRKCDYSRFKEQCLRVNALIKKTKLDYYSGIIQEGSNNPRTLFSTVNKVLPNRASAETPPSSKHESRHQTMECRLYQKYMLSYIKLIITYIIYRTYCSLNKTS